MPVAELIKTKATELEGVRAKMADLAKKVEDGSITADERATFKTLRDSANTLMESIEGAKADEELIADAAKAASFLDKPEHRVNHAINGDDDSRKSLMRAGWEIKSGVVLAPTSYKGRMQAMYPEEVLFGEIPADDVEAAAYFKAARATFSPDYREVYVKYMRLASKMRSEGMAFSMLSNSEQKALSEGTDSAGGYLVPPDVQAEILVRKADRAVMRQLCRTVTTSRDLLTFPRLQANASASPSPSVYSDGFVGDWAGETPAFSDTDPAFGQFQIAIKKIRVVTKLANDFINDAVANVLGILSTNGANNMALTEDKGFITGAGDALHPTGVTVGTAAANQVTTAGTTSNTISNTSGSLASGTLLLDLIYALPPQYRAGAALLMAPLTEKNIRKLVDGNNRFLWMPVSQSQFGGKPGQYDVEGYTVHNSQWMPADGTAGNINIVFGDFSAYIIADRAQISTVVLRERFADTDQTGIILFARVGGAAWNTDAFRFGLAG